MTVVAACSVHALALLLCAVVSLAAPAPTDPYQSDQFNVQISLEARQWVVEGHAWKAPRPQHDRRIAIHAIRVWIGASCAEADECSDALMIRHLSFLNINRKDAQCEGNERFAVFGEDLTPIDLPSPFAYQLDLQEELELSYSVARAPDGRGASMKFKIFYEFDWSPWNGDHVPVHPRIYGVSDQCYASDPWQLDGGDAECHAHEAVVAEEMRLVYALGHVQSTGGLNVSLSLLSSQQDGAEADEGQQERWALGSTRGSDWSASRGGDVLCTSTPEYAEDGHLLRMSSCSLDYPVLPGDMLSLTSCYQYLHAVNVRSWMLTYNTLEEEEAVSEGLSLTESIIAVILLLFAMFLAVSCVTAILIHGKTRIRRGAGGLKLLSRFEDHEDIGGELENLVRNGLDGDVDLLEDGWADDVVEGESLADLSLMHELSIDLDEQSIGAPPPPDTLDGDEEDGFEIPPLEDGPEELMDTVELSGVRLDGLETFAMNGQRESDDAEGGGLEMTQIDALPPPPQWDSD